MDAAKVAQLAVLLAIAAALMVGNVYFQRWNRRRGERLALDAAARGETLPSRTGVPALLALVGVLIFIGGVLLLRG